MTSTVLSVKPFASKPYVSKAFIESRYGTSLSLKGMIALRRDALEVQHEDFMDAILEVQAKKKMNLNYYA